MYPNLSSVSSEMLMYWPPNRLQMETNSGCGRRLGRHGPGSRHGGRSHTWPAWRTSPSVGGPSVVRTHRSVGHGYQPCRAEHTAKCPPSRQSLPACNVRHARLACPTPTSNRRASRQGGSTSESLLFIIIEQETEYSLTAENTAFKIWIHGFI